jgi:2',3'-cyclic-nucleotide 2'-phosphodiesterase (5'-nucleotidase family)
VVWSDTGKPIANPVIYRTYQLKAAPGRQAVKITVAIFSVLSESMAGAINYSLQDSASRIKVLDPVVEARKIVESAREKAQLVVALLHMDDAEAKKLAQQVPGIDVVVIGHGYRRKITQPLKLGSTLIVGESDQGKYVGQLILTLGSDGKIEASAGTSVAMDEAIPDNPQIAQMYKEMQAAQVNQGMTPITNIQAKPPQPKS